MTREELNRRVAPGIFYALEICCTYQKGEEVIHVLEKCLRFLRLFKGGARRTTYDVFKLVESVVSEFKNISVSYDADTRELLGDEGAIEILLKGIIQSAVYKEDTLIKIAVCERDEIPQIIISFDGPGYFPEIIDFGSGTYCFLDELENLWASATNGGWFNKTSSRYEMRLLGQKFFHDETACDERLLSLLEKAFSILKKGEGMTTSEVRNVLIEATNLLLPDAATSSAFDVVILMKRTLQEILPKFFVEFEKIEWAVLSHIPPLKLNRDIFTDVCVYLARLISLHYSPPNKVGIFWNYSTLTREAQTKCVLPEKKSSSSVYCLIHAVQFLANTLGARFDEVKDETGMRKLVLSLPDWVGKSLDTRLPGWQSFSDKTQQMLRMLENLDPDAKQDEFRQRVLLGLVEEELELRLLPLLSLPAVRNYAYEYDMSQSLAHIPKDRLEKILYQIARGKPKRELARPPYVGAVLQVFKGCAVFVDNFPLNVLSEEEFNEFSNSLSSSRSDWWTCLHRLGVILSNSSVANR